MQALQNNRPTLALGALLLCLFSLSGSACAHEQGSIGAMLARSHVTGRVAVRAVPPGTGRQAGLEPGDEIVAIDGKDVQTFSSDEEVRQALRGDVGTKVVLTVKREGARRQITVERGGKLQEK